jgi:hypothetical protein
LVMEVVVTELFEEASDAKSARVSWGNTRCGSGWCGRSGGWAGRRSGKTRKRRRMGVGDVLRQSNYVAAGLWK